MSELKTKLSEEMKSAMRAKEKERLQFARNLHAAVRKIEIDEKKDLDDAGLQKIVSTLLKQRRDSLEQFRKGGREDLASQEEAEIAFLGQFLPPQLSDDELVGLVKAAVEEAKADSPKQMGQVMKILLPKTQGRADGKRVSQLVRDALAQ